jgi:hypothetical protein
MVLPGAETTESKNMESLVLPRPIASSIPPPFLPFDQLGLNCNTVNAVAFLIQWFMFPEVERPYVPSRLYLYYYAREDADTTRELVDEGVSFSDVFAVLNLGNFIPDETEWFYNVRVVNKKPPPTTDESIYVPYVAVQLSPTLVNLKTCLETNGPFVAAVSATKDFELHAKYSYDPSDQVEGFQPLVFIQFSEEQQTFTAVNSFGSTWGDHGKVTLHVADLFKDPVFTSSIYTLVPELSDTDEEKSD